MKIVLPKRAVVVMCGAAGSGKTTFARRHFQPSQILSSDFCRQLVCDRVDWSPHVSPAAFRVLHTILEERLRHGLLTVIDSTAVHPAHRAVYVKMARRFRAPAILIVMNVPDTMCIERDRRRPQRVGERAIITQYELLQHGLETVDEEGFSAVYMLDERNQFNSEVIVGSGANGKTPAGNKALATPLPASAADLPSSHKNRNGAHARPLAPLEIRPASGNGKSATKKKTSRNRTAVHSNRTRIKSAGRTRASKPKS